MKQLLIVIIAFLVIACKSNTEDKKNSPLSVVIKLNCAEELGDLDEARQYQNINAIYKNAAAKDLVTPEECWRSWVVFGNKLGKDKKFTNQLKYFNYDIEETISEENAKVRLIAKDKKTLIQTIVYYLKLERQLWIVQKIEYKKGP